MTPEVATRLDPQSLDEALDEVTDLYLEALDARDRENAAAEPRPA